MKTTGSGSDGIFIVVAAAILLAAAFLVAGGPRELFDIMDNTLQELAGDLMRWIRVRL